MKLQLKLIVAGILLSLTTSFAFGQGFSRQSTTLPWHTDAKKAFAEAAEDDLPILAVFR